MAWSYVLPLEHLYFHWPFCASKCHYCPFVSFSTHHAYMPSYAHSLQMEMEKFGENYFSKVPIQTVYFGGGTPSICPESLLLDMLGTLRKVFILNESTEVTLEVNPGQVRKEQVKLWHDAGITRISMGVQSLKESALKQVNRHQSRNDVVTLLEQCIPLFKEISIDLMIGLPGVSPDEWREMVSEVADWPITHISLYILTVHEATPLCKKVEDGEIILSGEDEVMDLYSWTCQKLVSAGFDHYEISNFARPGSYSWHNLAYWQRKPYKGFGLAAASFDGQKRMVNEEKLLPYIAATMQGMDTVVFEETLTPEQVRTEKIMLGLRSMVGVSREDILSQGTSEERDRLYEHITELCRCGFIEEHEGALRLTLRGMAVENSIAASLV